jgi:transcriptional regulator with XRE-family HTH domain
MKSSNIIAERLKGLRDSVHLSQAKLAAQLGDVDQPSIFRYETAQALPTYAVFIKYADYFDVSLDYIFGRTDNPQGKLYDYIPKPYRDDTKMKEFIEMCFDPNSAANTKLKQAMLKVLEEEKNQ